MTEPLEITDARERTFEPGAEGWLIDDRGKTYKSLPTTNSFLRQHVVAAQEMRHGKPVGTSTYLRCDQVFFIGAGEVSPNPKANALLYKQLYERFVRPRRRQEFRERQQQAPRAYS